MSWLDEVKVGDTLRVFDVNGRRRGEPNDGCEGLVVKAGPKLLHVTYNGHTLAFRRETGATNDNYGHQYLRTAEQVADDMARDEAWAILRTHGLSRDFGRGGLSTPALQAIAKICEDDQ